MTAVIPSGLAVLLAGSLALGAGAAAGAPTVRISGTLADGSIVAAVVGGGKAKTAKWERCRSAVRGGKCARPQRIGTRPTLNLTGRTGQRIRVVVTIRGSLKQVASAWRVVGPAVTPAPPAPAAPGRTGSTRAAPVPLGQAAFLSDGWTMSVVSFTSDATAAVLAENMFNDPPAAGKQFTIARVQATNATTSPGSFSGTFRLRAVGPSNVSFSTFSNSCGVIPDPLPSTDVFPGGTIVGNVCWEVPAPDVGGLVLYDVGWTTISSEWTYFALR